MCTVTYIPSGDTVFITSNRDEKHWRLPAEPPAVLIGQTGRMVCPVDPHARGTWMAVHENGNALTLLNGAFERHESKPPYRKSRGRVLLDLLDHDHPRGFFDEIDVNGVEPFTAIICQQGGLYECRWDGSQKHARTPDLKKPHIWSSATLYDKAIAGRREAWFNEWLAGNPRPSQEAVLLFHQFTGDGDRYNDLMMNRDGLVFTVSITLLEIGPSLARMTYLDFKQQQSYQQSLLLTKAWAAS